MQDDQRSDVSETGSSAHVGDTQLEPHTELSGDGFSTRVDDESLKIEMVLRASCPQTADGAFQIRQYIPTLPADMDAVTKCRSFLSFNRIEGYLQSQEPCMDGPMDWTWSVLEYTAVMCIAEAYCQERRCRARKSRSCAKQTWAVSFGQHSPYNAAGPVRRDYPMCRLAGLIYALEHAFTALTSLAQENRDIAIVRIITCSVDLVAIMAWRFDYRQLGFSNGIEEFLAVAFQELEERWVSLERSLGVAIQLWLVKGESHADQLAKTVSCC